MSKSISIPFKDRKKTEKKKSTPPNPKKFLRRNQGKWGRVSVHISKSGARPPKATQKHTKSFVLSQAQKVKTKGGGGKKGSKLFPRPSARSKFIQQIKNKKKNPKKDEIQVLYKPPPKKLVSEPVVNEVENKKSSVDDERKRVERKEEVLDVQESSDWTKFNDVDLPSGNVFDIMVDKEHESFVDDRGLLDVVNEDPSEADSEDYSNPFSYDQQIEHFRQEEENNNYGKKSKEEEIAVENVNVVDYGFVVGPPDVSGLIDGEELEVDDNDVTVELREEPEDLEEEKVYVEDDDGVETLEIPNEASSFVNLSFDSQIYERELMDDNSPLSGRFFPPPRHVQMSGGGTQPRQFSGRTQQITGEDQPRQYSGVTQQVTSGGAGAGAGAGAPKPRIVPPRKKITGVKKKSNLMGKMFYNQGNDEQKRKKKKIEKWKRKVEDTRLEEEHQQKIRQLDEQLSIFKSRNESLVRSRAKLESEKLEMQNQQILFKKKHHEEVSKFNKMREREMKKLAREKRIMQRQTKMSEKYQSLKHVEKENAELKESISKMKKSQRLQMNRAKMEMEKMRQKISLLESEKMNLQEQVRQKELALIDHRFDARGQKKKMKSYDASLYGSGDAANSNSKSKEDTSFSNEEYVAQEVKVVDADVHPPHITSRMEDVIDGESEDELYYDEEEEEDYEEEEEENQVEEEELRKGTDYSAMVIKDSSLEPQISRLRSIYIEKEEEKEPVDRRGRIIKRNDIGNGKVEAVFEDGKREITYPNSTIKKVFSNGFSIVYFNNGDIKKTFPSKKVLYYYAAAKTTHISYLSKLEIFHFPNKQIERHYPNGFKEIIFPDGTKKYIHPTTHREEIHFPDGSVQVVQTKN